MAGAFPRVGLVHAVQPAIAPIHAAFARQWPQARYVDVTDLALPAQLEAAGGITQGIADRIEQLARQAADGAEAVLFTCTAFDAAIDAAAARLQVPLFKPNEALFDAGLAHGDRLVFIATFAPAVAGMEAGLRARARDLGRTVSVRSVCIPEALAAARAGDLERHNSLVAAVAPQLQDCDAILLAQFSTSTALDAAQALSRVPVLAAPDSAVLALKLRLTPAPS